MNKLPYGSFFDKLPLEISNFIVEILKTLWEHEVECSYYADGHNECGCRYNFNHEKIFIIYKYNNIYSIRINSLKPFKITEIKDYKDCILHLVQNNQTKDQYTAPTKNVVEEDLMQYKFALIGEEIKPIDIIKIDCEFKRLYFSLPGGEIKFTKLPVDENKFFKTQELASTHATNDKFNPIYYVYDSSKDDIKMESIRFVIKTDSSNLYFVGLDKNGNMIFKYFSIYFDVGSTKYEIYSKCLKGVYFFKDALSALNVVKASKRSDVYVFDLITNKKIKSTNDVSIIVYK